MTAALELLHDVRAVLTGDLALDHDSAGPELWARRGLSLISREFAPYGKVTTLFELSILANNQDPNHELWLQRTWTTMTAGHTQSGSRWHNSTLLQTQQAVGPTRMWSWTTAEPGCASTSAVTQGPAYKRRACTTALPGRSGPHNGGKPKPPRHMHRGHRSHRLQFHHHSLLDQQVGRNPRPAA